MHVTELQRFQAKINVDGRQAIINGATQSLQGAVVEATDLRAGAALIIAALAAQGESEIGGLHHIDRGYVDIVEKLNSLGAQVERCRQTAQTEPEQETINIFRISPAL
jgi:UDP-N-acetylglucosamine 1-carboxyvinyltransferase